MKPPIRPQVPRCMLPLVMAFLIADAAIGGDQPPPRFTLVLGGAGVKDHQTGLIWEQEPDRIHDVWSASVARCQTKDVGGQKSWRAVRGGAQNADRSLAA